MQQIINLLLHNLYYHTLLSFYYYFSDGLKLTMSTYYLIRSLRQFIQSVHLLNCSELDLTLISCFVQTLNSELDCFERVSPIDISDPARVSNLRHSSLICLLDLFVLLNQS